MSIACPSIIGLDKDEKFQEFKKHYSDRKFESDGVLLYNLQAYREINDLDIDWYPESEDDYAGFTNFLNAPAVEANFSVTKESLDQFYKTITTLYTPTMLTNRINRIASIAEDYITGLVKNSSFGVTRQQVINLQARGDKSGISVILEKTFDYIERLGTLDAQIAWYRRSNPKATDAEIEAVKDKLQYRANEFKKMADNKESLMALAALKLGADEGFSVRIDTLEYDFSGKEQEFEEIAEDQELGGQDSEEAQKGDRYIDTRTLPLSSSLSLDARRLLNNIVRLDKNGNPVRDDLGYPVKIDQKQAIIALHRVLYSSTDDTMIDDLKNATTRYPWLRNLIQHLEAHPDDATLIWCNFKKAKSIYFFGYKNNKKGGRIDVRQINNVADGKGISYEAGVNLSSGSVADESLSVITTDGSLVSKDKIAEIKAKVKELDKLKLAAKPQSSSMAARKYAVEDSVKDWRDQVMARDTSEFSGLADILRGLGFVVTDEDVKYALANSAPIASIAGTIESGGVRTTNYVSPLSRLVTAINDILDRADYITDSNDDVTGSHLFNYGQDRFSEIADILSVLEAAEVEERSISNKKALSASTTPNSIHELVDLLSNARGLSDAEYRASIIENFGRYEGMSLGFGDSLRLVGWLADFVNDGKEGSDESFKTKRKNFKVVDMTDAKFVTQKEFANLTSVEHAILSYVMYKRGTDNRTSEFSGHMYEVPIQADYDTAYNFVIAPSYSYDELVERLAQEVECEAQRIAAINERTSKDEKDKPRRALVKSTYEKRGVNFLIFPELNSNGFKEKYSEASDPDVAHQVVVDAVKEQLGKLIESERAKLTHIGFFTSDSSAFAGISAADEQAVNDWLLNSMYARLQITKLMYGGLEHFKSITDWEKRNMYSHATRLPLYTNATYHGEVVGKKSQRAIYFADDEVQSSAYNHIVAVAHKLKTQGKITEEQEAAMCEAYKSITTTDGQGVRTLKSLRSIKIMANIWSDSDEVCYQHIMSGEYGPADVQHFLIGDKPVYTGYEIIPAQEGQYQKPVRVPVLHKYSEMVLLPEMMEDIDAQTGTSPFRAMNQINKELGKDNEIDLFLFGSCVKVGAHSVMDPFEKDDDGNRVRKNSKEIKDYVLNNLKLGSFWIHDLPLKYYGIAASIHSDVEDEYIAWATQAEKEAWGNIEDDEEIIVAGKPMKAIEARQLYYTIKAARSVDAYKRLSARFADPAEVAKILKEELAGKPYQARDVLFALQMRDCKNLFAFPLFTPTLEHDAIAMLASIVRKTFTKVPTRGANMTQTTSFGLDAEIESRTFAAEGALKDFENLEVKFDKEGNFQYVEAIVPITDSAFERFADENGNITPTRLNQLVKDGIIPESALYFIAYRTPSDAEHSVIPCRIKGFSCKAAGASIKLPREVMKMTGHDYDGDKMRCHFKQLYLGWNDKAIRKAYDTMYNTEFVTAVLDPNKDPNIVSYEVFRKNVTAESNPERDQYRAVKEEKYDWGKNPWENISKSGNYGALNNAMVDLLFGQLTSENGGLKMFIPGGCAETVQYADEIGTRAVKEEIVTPFATTHATESHDYMMEGANMIGVFALYNSASAMLQRINLNYVEQENSSNEKMEVILFGNKIGALYPIKSNDAFNNLGESRLLNAAVDNGKDPLLGYLNQSEKLAHITNFLSAAGVSEKQIHLIFNQSVIRQLVSQLKSVGQDVSVPEVISALVSTVVRENKGERKQYTQDWALKRIAILSESEVKKACHQSYTEAVGGKDWENQVAWLLMFQHINPAARDLEQIIKLTRPESDAGGIDSSLGGIISKLIQLDKFRERLNSANPEDKVRIRGAEKVLALRNIYENIMTPKMIMDEIGTELPEVVALNSLMKDSILKMLSPYFPQARESWLKVERKIADHYSYDRIPESAMNYIMHDMVLYKLLQDPNFVTGNPQQEQERIVKDVPTSLRALKRRIDEAKKNPGKDKVADSLVDNIFLNNLDLGTTIGGDGNNIDRIRFRMNGTYLENTADEIRAAWGQLLYTGDESIKQLALDLFKYNMYTNGFNFGKYEFSHFAPINVILNVPGYIKSLNSILESNWTDDDTDMMYHQFIRNHWGDKNLVPQFQFDELPVGLRLQIVEEVGPSVGYTEEQFDAALEGKDYILVRTKDKNGDNEDTLYQVKRANGTNHVEALIKAEKLGIRNKGNQIIVQYNPRVRSLEEIKPVFASNKVVWEGRGSDSSDINKDAGTEVGKEISSTPDEADFIESTVHKMVEDRKIKKLEEESKKASAANMGKFSAEDIKNMPGFEDEEFCIVSRDENGNIVNQYLKGTPAVVEKAREQQAFVELNQRLREILASVGVRIGTLERAEEILSAGGVADFKLAHVLVEGMAELIRLSNNEEVAEYALPEEFAHVALEMLGAHSVGRDEEGNIVEFNHDNKDVKDLLNYLNTHEYALREAFGDQYDKYVSAYSGNREKLIKEAAGKLVAQRMFWQQYAKTPSTRNRVRRVIDAIKEFFRNPLLSIRRLYDALFGAEHIASRLAKDLLSGKLADEMSLDKITTTEKYYQIDKDLSNKEDILSKLIKYTTKRFDTLKSRLKYAYGKGSTSTSIDATRRQLSKLEYQLENEKVEKTVLDYLGDTMQFMTKMEKELDDAIANRPANSVCRKLQVVKDTLFSFSAAVKDIKEALDAGELQDDVNLKQTLKDVSDKVSDFWTKYNRISLEYFEKFLSNVYGEDGVTVTIGKDKGRHISIHEMATKADHDISMASRLLSAVSDCDDYVLLAIDDVTRNAKMNARMLTAMQKPRIEAAMAALVKEQGNRDQSWMFEKDANGKKTGRYISRKEADKLSDARKKFYYTFMDVKSIADSCLPDALTGNERKMIMFRKMHYEKMREAQEAKDKFDEVWDNAKRSVLEMGDVDFEKEFVFKDFNDNMVDMFPIKFLNKSRSESYDDMTEDVATSIMAYLGMATEYREMNNVIGLLENARYASSMRDVEQKRGFRSLFTRAGDKEKGFHYQEPYTVKQAHTLIQKCMDDFFHMHVYGHLQDDEGTFGKTRISKRKTANALAGYTSLAQMAINIHQRIANVNTGFTQIIVESAGGEINAKDVAWAAGIWMKESGDRLADTGKTDYDNKLSLFMDKFDIHQDNGREVNTTKYGKSDASRAFNTHLIYAGLTIGEDFLAGTTALAYAKNYKMLDNNGKECTLWDAYEVKYVDEQNKTGAYLALKDGYKKADGSAMTFEDEKAFQKKVISKNFELQGIYNVDDRSAIQKHSLGALALMYRKWVAPAIKRRYAGVRYSKLQDSYTEGYYRTAIRMVGNTVKDWFAPATDEEAEKTVFQLMTDFHAMKDSIVLNWDKMTDYEKGNCKKAFREMTIMLGLILASGLLKNLPPDDHDGNEFLCWADNFALTQLLRLRAEIGSQAPTPGILGEAQRILSSPFAALRPIVDTLNGLNLLLPHNYWEEIESGRYKGHTKAYRYFVRLPIISLFKKLDNVIDPTPLLNYYSNQNAAY